MVLAWLSQWSSLPVFMQAVAIHTQCKVGAPLLDLGCEQARPCLGGKHFNPHSSTSSLHSYRQQHPKTLYISARLAATPTADLSADTSLESPTSSLVSTCPRCNRRHPLFEAAARAAICSHAAVYARQTVPSRSRPRRLFQPQGASLPQNTGVEPRLRRCTGVNSARPLCSTTSCTLVRLPAHANGERLPAAGTNWRASRYRAAVVHLFRTLHGKLDSPLASGILAGVTTSSIAPHFHSCHR